MTPKNRFETHNERRISEIRQRTLELGANPGALIFRQWKAKQELKGENDKLWKMK